MEDIEVASRFGVGEEYPDDPIAAEIPVLLNQNAARALVLAQYPLRPRGSLGAYFGTQPEGGEQVSLHVKHQQPKLQFSIPLDTDDTMYYDASSIPQTAPSLAAPSTSEGKVKPEPGTETNARDEAPKASASLFVLRSSMVPMKTAQAIGVLETDANDTPTALHLNPLRAVVQLRPAFDHLDEKARIEAERIKNANAIAFGSGSGSTSVSAMGLDEDEDAQPAGGAGGGRRRSAVNVKTTKKESERAMATRKRSHEFMKAEEAKQKWTRHEWFPYHDVPADLHSSLTPSFTTTPVYKITSSQYLTQLNNILDKAITTSPGGSGLFGSAQGLLPAESATSAAASVADTIKSLLASAVVVPHVLAYRRTNTKPPSNDEASKSCPVIGALLNNAVIVAGHWVARASLLRSLPDRVRHARSRLLALWNENPATAVFRPDFARESGLSGDQAKQLLSSLGLLVEGNDPTISGRVWVFKLPRSDDLEAKLPGVVARSLEVLKRESRSAEEYFGSMMEDSGLRQVQAPVPAALEGRPLAALGKFFKGVLEMYGLLSLDALNGQFVLQQQAGAPGTNPLHHTVAPVTEDMYMETLAQIAMKLHNETWTLIPTEDDHLWKAKKAILEAFSTKSTLTKAVIEKALTKAGVKLTDTARKGILHRYASSNGGNWSLKKGDIL